MVLPHEIPPVFRGGVHLLNRHTPSGHSRIYRVTQLRTPVVLKVVPVTGAALAGQHGPINVRLSFPTFTFGMEWTCLTFRGGKYSTTLVACSINELIAHFFSSLEYYQKLLGLFRACTTGSTNNILNNYNNPIFRTGLFPVFFWQLPA